MSIERPGFRDVLYILIMKCILSLFLLLTFFVNVQAQSDSSLSVDERGKLIYYEVVDLKGIKKDSLKNRLIIYFQKKPAVLKFTKIEGDTSFFATGKFVINKTVLVMSHPSGEISYNAQVEIKDGKYRFWLTDFNFIPYKRDRYGNFVPTTTTGIALENESGKINAVQLKEYKTQTAIFSKEFALKFKAHMASKVPITLPITEKRVVSKNW